MYRNRSTTLLIGALTTPFLFAACSSGSDNAAGGGGGGGGGAPASANAGDLIFFQGSIKAIDPADPSTILTIVDDSVDASSPIITGRFEAAAKAFTDTRIDSVLYLEDGALHHVDGTLRNGQVVDEVLAQGLDDVDSLEVTPDPTGNGKEQIMLIQDDGTVELMPLDKSGGIQELDGDPFTELFDPATGKFLGYLATDDNSNIIRIDVDTSSNTLTTSNVTPFANGVEDLEDTFDGKLFLAINGEIVVYDVATNEVEETGLSLFGQFAAGTISSTTLAGNDLIVMLVEIDQVDIVKVQSDGTQETIFEADDASLGAGGCFPQIETVGNRLVFSYTTDNGCQLQSILFDGSDLQELGSEDIDFFQVGGSDVVFNIVDEDDAIFEAHVVSANGATSSFFQNAAWAGAAIADATADGEVASSLFLVRGINADGSYGNGTLHEVDPANPSATRTNLGTLPEDVEFFVIAGFGNPLLGLAIVENPGSVVPGTDLFFVDASRANSLFRVTDDPTDFVFPFVVGDVDLGDFDGLGDIDDFDDDFDFDFDFDDEFGDDFDFDF